MKKLIIIFLWMAPLIGCGQTYVHTTVREEALSDPDFFSKLWISEKGVYRIQLYIPEQDQVVQDTISEPVMIVNIDTVQQMVMEDPLMPALNMESDMVMDSKLSEHDLAISEKSTLSESPIKIKPKPAPVLMTEDVKVLQLKIGTRNTLELKDTTYWIIIDGNNKQSEPIKPTVRKEWECCYLIYEWIIKLDADQYFEIWHNDRIKDFEQGDWVEARDQYFSEVLTGERIPDYYHGLILKVEAWKP